MDGQPIPSGRRKRLALFLIRVVWGLTAIFFVLVFIFARSVPLIGILRTALVASLWPAAILLPLALLIREWRWAALLAIPALGLVILFAPYFTPRTQAPSEGVPVITVMTFNIHQPADTASLEAVAQIIRESNADLVALQELGPSPETLFGPLLIDAYPYQSFHANPGYPGSGQGMLSRYPLLEEEYWLAGGPWNGNLRVVVEAAGQRIVIYNTHPHPPIERGLVPEMASHAAVIREIVDRAEAEDAPTLIAGDFNMTDQFEPYQWITTRHTDAYRAVGSVGFGFTHPDYERYPIPRFWRIDRIFYDDHFRGIEALTLPQSGPSDHLPVIARVQIVE